MKTLQIDTGFPEADIAFILTTVFPGMEKDKLHEEGGYIFLKAEDPESARKELRKYCFRICKEYSDQ